VKLLLDTHAFLWWVAASGELSRKAQSTVASARNECFVSVASGWEIAIEVSLGTLKVQARSTASCPSSWPPTASRP
jgi:PIN domain nuclease of toxin-antitoxin system